MKKITTLDKIDAWIPKINTKKLFLATSYRNGGVSDYPFSSLNMASYNDDSIENIERNRQLFCMKYKLPYERLITCNQVHDNNIQVIDNKLGSFVALSSDGLITNVRDILLGIITADCLPIFVFNDNESVIGIFHAGWKGTYENILTKGIEKICKIYNENVNNINVVIGPGISVKSYEVGDEFRDYFEYLEERDDSLYLNLYKENIKRAIDIGINKDKIIAYDSCTALEPDKFYSYRKEKPKTGRMLSVIMIK